MPNSRKLLSSIHLAIILIDADLVTTADAVVKCFVYKVDARVDNEAECVSQRSRM